MIAGCAAVVDPLADERELLDLLLRGKKTAAARLSRALADADREATQRLLASVSP